MATGKVTGGNNITEVHQKVKVRGNEEAMQYQNNHSEKVMALTPNSSSYYLEKEKIKDFPVRLKEVHNVKNLLSKHGENNLL